MSRLVRSISVLEHDPENSPVGLVAFTHELDKTDKENRSVILSMPEWEDLGAPREITIVIYPGDKIASIPPYTEEF